MLTRVLTLAERVGFGSPPESAVRQSTSAVRVAASGLVALTGFVLLVPNLAPFLRGADDGLVVALSLLGSAVSAGLVAAGGLLYRSRFSDRNAARIAVWNLLGVSSSEASWPRTPPRRGCSRAASTPRRSPSAIF
ncbi:hypothetical protein NDI76_02580 [Halogeometricum sp. S1BR25-6]|uniref:Uncharacterized protein n=1 Tax=Halogeometricum salsisoli TaxID=2950536 RepID=A0ABU2GA00_9EURY|nr:hypothetical protein [Halogeometricum sp. S1BR25-6]MDS0297625.1 hypothetical protein [Halogeometricum sp. S1BR25-6]